MLTVDVSVECGIAESHSTAERTSKGARHVRLIRLLSSIVQLYTTHIEIKYYIIQIMARDYIKEIIE